MHVIVMDRLRWLASRPPRGMCQRCGLGVQDGKRSTCTICRPMSDKQCAKIMRSRVPRSMAAVADDLGITQSYMSYIINGKRKPSDAVLAALGIRRVDMGVLEEDARATDAKEFQAAEEESSAEDTREGELEGER